MKVSVIIPTLQAEKGLPDLLSSLSDQTLLPCERIVIDSSSTDRTLEIARERGWEVMRVPRQEFRHGRTRNLAARATCGEILVFLTQDVLPVNRYFLEELVHPIQTGQAVAATARQIPFPHANPIEAYSRSFNYPDRSHVRDWGKLPAMGIKAFFFSNSASAIDRETFCSLGGFSENLIVNEDMELCARLLRSGYAVAYQARALVYHSHNYSLIQLFQRYFDIGVFFKQGAGLLHGAHVSREGKRFVFSTARHLMSNEASTWVPRLLLETGIKWIAFELGNHNDILPVKAKQKLSGQGYYWN